jgi:membrane associated rhomboid family serine protease
MPIDLLERWFSVYPYSVAAIFQVWRLITYQFLHGGFWHILINMWILFILGPGLERQWGRRRFLIFYLSCGVAGGLLYTLLVATDFLAALPMVGASGAILGVFAACAILFPQFRLFLFPIPVAIPIRIMAAGAIVMYVFFVVTRADNAGGHAAHLAGMVAGAFYVLSESWRAKMKLKLQVGAWERKMTGQQNLEAEVDRILRKIHTSGIHSLTPAEKKTLKQATEAEQMRDEFR